MKIEHPSRRRVAAALLAAPALVALGRSAAAVEVGRARRIVSLGGAATEILYALGCGERVVAVDLTSRFPDEVRKKPNVGYYRAISAEGVLALGPDLIVASDGAGPKEAIDVLKAAAVGLLSLPEIKTQADIPARIRAVAEAVGESGRGTQVADAVAADLAALRAEVSRLPRRRSTLVLLGPSRGSVLMAAGAGSTGAFALELAGADNAAAATSGWKPLTDEAAYGMAPEAIVVLATSAPVTAEDIAARPALAGSPAVKEGRVVVADALATVGFGPRAAHAARSVAERIYPEQAFAPLPARPWTA
jgi:iron complex transport system substrate-binding protein